MGNGEVVTEDQLNIFEDKNDKIQHVLGKSGVF